ncbi:circadian-associated transcriptional repressor, partial [Struthio camelus]|uniref:circadian-associated transcriptional repressor n=1 Tax=Struthio camelus TaxID=8801 RepID=UPI003603DD55
PSPPPARRRRLWRPAAPRARYAGVLPSLGDTGQPRTEKSRKRLAAGERGCPEFAAHPAPHGAKRQRNGDAEPSDGLKSPLTDGDRLFAQKCRELQGFIRPLAELLNGLKMGRYEKGLSSFQQSVAMDRIQRIIGVLQKPEMGERYLGTLLQVEMMLKLWFPHVAPKTACSDRNPGAAATAERRWRRGDAEEVPPAVAAARPGMSVTWVHAAPICTLPPPGAATAAAAVPDPCAAAATVLFLPARAASAGPRRCSPGPAEPLRCRSLPRDVGDIKDTGDVGDNGDIVFGTPCYGHATLLPAGDRRTGDPAAPPDA